MARVHVQANERNRALLFMSCVLLFSCLGNAIVEGLTSPSHGAPLRTQAVIGRTARASIATTTTTRPLQMASSSPFWEGLFAPKQQENKKKKKPVYEKVVIDKDYRLPIATLLLGLALDTIPYIQLTLGPFITLLAILFFVVATTRDFVFTADNQLQIVATQGKNNSDEDSDDGVGENIVVGGANRWDCSTIVNYEFFPKSWMYSSLSLPVLIYFKETQTDPDKWNVGPGKWANDPAKIERGDAVPGQVHFFPAAFNAQQFRSEFSKRGCGKL